MIDQELLAWAAGFFEGEGCVGTSAGKPRLVMLTVVNTDLDRLRWFAEIVNGGRITQRREKPGLKTQYQWQAYSESAIRIFRDLAPWLGERRRNKFDEAVAKRAAYIADVTCERACGGCGSMFRPTFNSQSSRAVYCSLPCGQKARDVRRARARAEDIVKLLDENVRAA